jgi:hypothetical protein
MPSTRGIRAPGAPSRSATLLQGRVNRETEPSGRSWWGTRSRAHRCVCRPPAQVPGRGVYGLPLRGGCRAGTLRLSRGLSPPLAGQALQVMVGVIVGLRVTRDAMRSGTSEPAPRYCACGCLSRLRLRGGRGCGLLTGMTPVTALFAAAPGGLTEMAAVGASLGATGPPSRLFTWCGCCWSSLSPPSPRPSA